MTNVAVPVVGVGSTVSDALTCCTTDCSDRCSGVEADLGAQEEHNGNIIYSRHICCNLFVYSLSFCLLCSQTDCNNCAGHARGHAWPLMRCVVRFLLGNNDGQHWQVVATMQAFIEVVIATKIGGLQCVFFSPASLIPLFFFGPSIVLAERKHLWKDRQWWQK